MSHKYVFVVGVGRSGTSLLQTMLAAHPEITFPPETAFLRRYIATGRIEELLKNGGVQSVLSELEKDDKFQRTKLSSGQLINAIEEVDSPTPEGIYRTLLGLFANEKGNVICGDKDPRIVEWLPLLARVLPGCFVVHIIRDPRDVLLSKKKAQWSSSGLVWKHIFANRVQLNIGRSKGSNDRKLSYCEVVYEQLISSPEAVLEDLCKRIGIAFESSMLEFESVAQELVSEDELSWKKETLGPLLKDNKGKWKTELEPREIVLTEICCHSAFQIGDYIKESEFKVLPLADKVWVLMGAASIFAWEWPYRFYRALKVGHICKRIR